jgi:Putative DNA-binding domain
MRDLYEQLVAGGEPAIEQLRAERRQENVSLEFKTKANSGTGEPNRDDRRNLGIALSAFSNSMGGLIVWGVRAEKNADNVDCAIELQPIGEIERFKADVTRLLSQALMPRHEGIFVEAIPAGNPQGAGYLAIYVERSERRPHRCEFVERQYFKRTGDSSVAMEHYDIEDSFKRLVVPWLEVEWLIRPGQTRGGPDPSFRQVVIDICLRNPSPVTARFPYLNLRAFTGATVQPAVVSDIRRSRYRTDRGEFHFDGGADDVIHPDVSLPAAQILTPEIPVESAPPLRQMLTSSLPISQGRGQCYIRRGSLQPVTVAYQCSCYNSRPAKGEFTVSEDQLVEHGIVGGFIY